MAALEATSSQSHQQQPLREDARAAGPDLREAAAVDAVRLSGPGGPTYLIVFLDELQTALEAAESDEVADAAPVIKENLKSIWSATVAGNDPDSAALCAGRPYRSILCRIYVILFTKVGATGVFDAASEWSKLALNQTTRLEIRIIAFHLYAAILASMGNAIHSLAVQNITEVLRVFRTNSLPNRLRYAASLCLSGIISSSGFALSESEARDVYKNLKACLTHDIGVVQRAAADCLQRLFTACYVLQNTLDIESTLVQSFKAQESADWQTRQQHAELCSSLLLLTQVPRSTKVEKAARNRPIANKTSSDAADDDSLPTHAAASAAVTTTLLTPKAMVQRLLNAYSQQSATSKGRNAVMQTLALLLVRLGPTYVCDNFSEIWEAIRTALLVGSHNKNNERQSRITEDYITFIIGKMVFNHLFHEKEQMATMKYFTEQLDGFQVMLDKGVRDVSLVPSINVTLQQIQCLLRAFGQSTVPEISLLEGPLLRLSENAVIDVHSAAQSCLAVYTCTMPSRLQPLILQRIDSSDNYLQTHASNSDAQEIDRANILGQTGIISCLLPLLQRFPLYASNDVCARTVSLASRLLKTSGDRDLTTSAMMVRAAWQLLEAVLGLTKRYFGVHLPQILLLWRNALPKASSRELAQVEGRTPQDWIFLLSIREAVLRSMSTFLEKNSAEAHEGDIMRRLVALLHHAMAFYTSIPTYRRQNEDPTRVAELTKMEECQNVFLGSLMRAFTLVGPQQVSEQTRIALCTTCMVQFARFGNRARSTHSGINHVNQTQNIWESNETLPSFLQNDESSELDPAAPSFGTTLSMATKELIIEGLPRRIQRMAEDLSTGDQYEKSILIDSPARLFASLFPTLSSVDQIRLLDSLLKLHQQTSSEAASSRQDRSSSFVSVTLLAILELVARQLVQVRKDSGPVDESVLTLLRDALFSGVGSPDSAARNFCCRGIASLCIIASSSFLSRQVQSTVSQIVTDTHPAVRAGCVQLLAQIYQAIGAIGARPVLKTIIEVVMTLIVDPHPTVHFWSLRALANIIETAGLDFTPYITTCSRLLLKLSAADSHDPEGGSTSTSALRGDLPVRQAVGAVVDQLISAAGPSLWEDKWASRAAYAHVQSFLLDDDVRLVVQGGSALQHLLLISPQEIISPHLIRILLSQLFSSNMQVQMSAVNSIYQVVRRDAPTLSKLGGDKLVERLFTILDADPSVDGVKQTILTWLLQTADSNPAGWLIICHRIFSQELASWQAPDADAGAATVEDEEAQSLGSVFADTSAARGYLARWQTRSFALTCVQSLLNHIQESPHIQALPQRRGADVSLRKLYPKIQDLIRLALLSSTSVNLDLKLSGLALLEQIIVTFRHAVDTTFDQAPLLEQYQASIIAAAAPAFQPDAEPEVLIAALKLCGQFLASGISRQSGDLKRALNLLEACLERYTNTSGLDAASPASFAIQMACGAAWARVGIARGDDKLVDTFLGARAATLLTLWRNLLLEVTPSSLVDHAVSTATEEMTLHVGSDVDLESWLLVLKAWTTLSARIEGQPNLAGHSSDLLGKLCLCIDRHLLAERLQSGTEALAGLMLDNMNNFLALMSSLSDQSATMSTWDELLQIAYRLNLLDNITVDTFLVRLVAILAVYARDKSHTDGREVRLRACARLELLLLARNLEKGTDRSTELAASAWSALLVVSKSCSREYQSEILALPWVLLQRQIPAMHALFPAALIQAILKAAVLYAHEQLEAGTIQTQSLDRLIAGFLSSYDLTMRGQAAKNPVPTLLHLQVLAVLGEATHESGLLITAHAQDSLCSCIARALDSGSVQIAAGGIALAKSLACGPSSSGSQRQSPLSLARVVAELILPLHEAVLGGNNAVIKLLLHLMDELSKTNYYAQLLILEAYAWLSSECTEATVINRAIMDMARQQPQSFKRAFAQLSASCQQALQQALKDFMLESGSANTRESVQPTIELKLFS